MPLQNMETPHNAELRQLLVNTSLKAIKQPHANGVILLKSTATVEAALRVSATGQMPGGTVSHSLCMVQCWVLKHMPTHAIGVTRECDVSLVQRLV